MNKEIEQITALFDEFYIIDTPQEDVKFVKSNKEKISSGQTKNPVDVSESTLNPGEQPEKINSHEISFPILNFSGANKQHIAIIYNDKNNDSRENVEMLSNLITKALKLTMDDVAIIRLSKNEGYNIFQIFDFLETKKAILWGAEELLAKANISGPIHSETIIGSTQILIADEVYKYITDLAYKAKLWEAIQPFFKR